MITYLELKYLCDFLDFFVTFLVHFLTNLKNTLKKYRNNIFHSKTDFRAFQSQLLFLKRIFIKVFSLFKNGQKKCPKSKT